MLPLSCCGAKRGSTWFNSGWTWAHTFPHLHKILCVMPSQLLLGGGSRQGQSQGAEDSHSSYSHSVPPFSNFFRIYAMLLNLFMNVLWCIFYLILCITHAKVFKLPLCGNVLNKYIFSCRFLKLSHKSLWQIHGVLVMTHGFLKAEFTHYLIF